VWNETFVFDVDDPVRDTLLIKVRDKDFILLRDDPIGKNFRVLISDIVYENGKLVDYAFKLDGTQRKSKLVLRITYTEPLSPRSK